MSISKKDIKFFALMFFIAIIAPFPILMILRARSFLGLLNHLLRKDIIFILKWLSVSVFAFVFQVCCFLWCKKNSELVKKCLNKKTNSKKLIVPSIIFLVLATFLFAFTIWCSNNYPINEPETVFFVLCSPLDNAKNIFFINLFKFVVLPTLCCLCSLVVFFLKKKSFHKFVCIIFIALFPISFVFFFGKFKINAYFYLLKNYNAPAEYSEFWEENFIAPQIAQIEFPAKKRNLIFIFLESMESSFADYENGGCFEENYIPNLTRLAKENVNFSHNQNKIGGGIDVARTSWTVAAMTAKLGGLPQNLSAAVNPTKLPHFLPKATFLTDILCANGYKMLFLCGSNKGFASRDKLFEDHGNVEVHDLNWYRQNGFLPAKYDNGFWGFEDLYLYEFAKQEIDELSKNDAPFCFSFLTVDTHYPEGFICSKCGNKTTNDFQIKNVLKCADQQIADFIDWCKTQSWYDNTTIVITGDHNFMIADEYKNLFDAEKQGNRRWIDIFINSAVAPKQGATQNRSFSSFDIFPTTLASIGATFPDCGRGIGFGRNLFSGYPTIVEQYGFDVVNIELSKKIQQFEELVY